MANFLQELQKLSSRLKKFNKTSIANFFLNVLNADLNTTDPTTKENVEELTNLAKLMHEIASIVENPNKNIDPIISKLADDLALKMFNNTTDSPFQEEFDNFSAKPTSTPKTAPTEKSPLKPTPAAMQALNISTEGMLFSKKSKSAYSSKNNRKYPQQTNPWNQSGN